MTAHSRWLFGTAAAFNFVVAAGLLFLRPSIAPLLQLAPIEGTNLVFVNLSGGLIGLFGYAYIRLAANPIAHRAYIPLSVVGKLIAVVGTVWPWSTGAIPWILPALVSADAIFVLLFLDFLRRTPTMK